jgi:peptidoglycan/xylan/chitin deacetylase (PgdA/CDA1 family)
MPQEKPMSRRRFIQTSAGVAVAGGATLANLAAVAATGNALKVLPVPDKLVVLSFDDAARSQRTFVAPLLQDLGFGASFFVCHRWMADRDNFMTWKEIAEIHQMGFEIGNHSWTHGDYSTPLGASRLAGELALVERQLEQVGVPKPVSFGWCGDTFGPEALQVLIERGYRFARRGMEPEIPYGEMRPGPAFDPQRHHPLLVPTTGDAYPDWTLEYFKQVVERARDGKIVVIQMHGVPDLAHPWVYTPPEQFRKYMMYLKENGFRAIAMRELEQYVNLKNPPDDPLLKARFPRPKYGPPAEPIEVVATRADLKYWLGNMLLDHRYTLAEAAKVCGLSPEEVRKKAEEFVLYPPPSPPGQGKKIRVLPYPGGRHPRIGFKEGAIDFMRGTKASVFLPWNRASYVVIDLPEAIFCNLGLIWLAHYDIPTVWDDQNVVLENIDWTRKPEGLSYQRTLPRGIVFGASIRPAENHVEMELWLRNFSGQRLSGFHDQKGIRAQVCVLLKGAPEFNRQTNDNKVFQLPGGAVRSAKGNRWILTRWEPAGRVWGNQAVPCLHSDPNMPDSPFGTTVRARGRLWFYEGNDVERELQREDL